MALVWSLLGIEQTGMCEAGCHLPVMAWQLLQSEGILRLRWRRHAYVIREHAAVNAAVHGRKECRRGAGVERHLAGQLIAIAIHTGEVVEELPPSLKLRTRREPCHVGFKQHR